MKAGRMRHPISILQAVVNRDAFGENIQTWTDILDTWGEVLQLRGSLLALAQARTATVTATHSITVRANVLILPTCRVQFGEVFYTITSILDPDSRGRQMTLLCTVVTA